MVHKLLHSRRQSLYIKSHRWLLHLLPTAGASRSRLILQAPRNREMASMQYVVEVSNNYVCSAKDSVLLKAGCNEKGIFIPTAFTPNSDGLNDRFTVNGMGVSIIKSLRIFNRWGEIVFEKRNFYPNDYNAAWNGKYRGVDAPAETYVYVADLECNTGEALIKKGSVTLIR